MTIRHARGDAANRWPPKMWIAIPAMAMALSGCQLATDSPPAKDEPKGEAATKLPTLPTPTVQDIAVDRRQLLLAVNEAISAAATGADDNGAQSSLVGRQFILKLPLGCTGESDAASGWIYDEASQRLTVKATPDVTLADLDDVLPVTLDMPVAFAPAPEAAAPADAAKATDAKATASASAQQPSKIEAVDGFWIPRPWIFTDACPVDAAASSGEETEALEPGAADGEAGASTTEENVPAANPVTPTVAIAHFYTARDPRVGRRNGQPYRITKRVTEAERPSPQSLRLVLRGRLGMMPGGKVIQCSTPKDGSQPRCVISASFDRVSFENVDGSIVYAEWGGG